MSSGTSAGNIITEAPGTYGARSWLTGVKQDAFGVISDAQLTSIIGANWFNNVDDNLLQVNEWFSGGSEAPHIKAAEATIGTLNFTAASADTLMVGPGALTDAPEEADDLVIGELDAADRGLSILSTGVGYLAFADTAATLTGYLSYTHLSDTLGFGVAGATELNLTADELAPATSGGLSLGSASLRWANAYVATSVSIGDATGSSSLTLDKDGAEVSDVAFANEGAVGWRLRHRTDETFAIERCTDGVLQTAVTFSGITAVAFPASVTVGLNLAVSGDLSSSGEASFGGDAGFRGTAYFRDDNGQRIIMTLASGFAIQRYNDLGVHQDSIVYDLSTGAVTVPWSLIVGSSSTSSVLMALSKNDSGSASFAFLNDGVARWAFATDSSETLYFRRYNSSGTLLDAATVNASTGEWQFPKPIGFSGSTSRVHMGSGVPSAGLGSNGDLYIRTNSGATSTCLYYKISGSWSALAT